jgi:uncharacterized lipoprotein YmbA
MRRIVLACAALLVACAGSSSPERTQYLLRAASTVQAGRIEAPVRVGVGRVVVAPYLDQAGIVIETAPGQVRVARQHQWAEPLQAGLRTLLRSEISNALGYEVSASGARSADWDYTVDVSVDRLHGAMSGVAVIDAGYRISGRDGADGEIEFRFSRSTPLPREGYPGVVDAHVELARQLATAIAASLRELQQVSSNPRASDESELR